ncbi:MAG: glycosyltransferase family 2 protein [Cyclobacteriaceae bacterium]
MNTPEVSVIVINYNTWRLTCACIESVRQRAVGVSTEIILVDNASTERPATDFLGLFPDITLIASPTNVGFSAGNNLGIAKARGRYILLLNSDAELINDAVTVCRDFLVQHPDVAAVSGLLQYPNGIVQHCCQRFPSIGARLYELLRLQKFLPGSMTDRVLLGSFFDHRRIIFPDWVWGTCFMFPVSVLEIFDDGKLPQDFFMYGEDMEWCMEFRRRGYRIGYQPEAQVLHHLGQSKAPRNSMMEANMSTFMRRYYAGWQRSLISLLDKML